MKRVYHVSLLIVLVFGLTPVLFGFQTGNASWYGGKFQGRPTANGEIFDTNKFTAAHRTLPFGTHVKVTNLRNGKSTVVRINDRGPFIQGRIIDLSKAAAEAIGMIDTGTAPVSIEVVEDVAGRAAEVKQETSKYDLSERYTIQVGSFSMTRNALSMRKKLETHGLPAVFESGGEGIVRVILPNIEASALDSVREKLSEAGITDILVRRN
jgi:rare lipoprotein A